jgi:hypothetical protein
MNIIEHYCDPAHNHMKLQVVASGKTVIVKAGVVRQTDKDYTLAEDAEFDIPANIPEGWEAHAHLVIDKEGTLSVFVEDGGPGTPMFLFAGSGYTKLYPIWSLYDLPKGAITVEGGRLHVSTWTEREVDNG